MGGAVGAAIISYGLTRGLFTKERPPELQPERIEPPAVKPRKLVMSEASLEKLRSEALALCERALGQGDAALQAQVVEGLGRTCDIRYGAQLIHMLRRDTDPNVRAKAALALGRIGFRSQQRALLDTLQQKVAPEQLAATVEALFRLAEHQAQLDELQKILRQGLNSPVPLVRLRSAFLLAPLDQTVQRNLWQLVEAHSSSSRDPGDLGLLWRLCQCRFEPAVRRIDQLLADPRSEQAVATSVLMPYEGWPATLNPPSQWVRARAILAEAALVHGQNRLTAACGLAQLGLRPADASVLRWLRELAVAPTHSEAVRQQALTGLAFGGDVEDLHLLTALFAEQGGGSLSLRIEAATAALRILSTLPSQLDEQAIIRAEQERLSGSGSTLFLSIPSLKALEKVFEWLERGGRPEDAWLLNELLERLQERKMDTGPARRRLDSWLSAQPKEGLAAHRIRAALSNEPQDLAAMLLHRDEQVRLWSAERLIRKGQVPHTAVQALQGLSSGQNQIHAFGLLRMLNVEAALPRRRLEASLRSKDSSDRQAAIEALANWPMADARPYLEQAVADPDPGVRRRLLEVLEMMIRHEPAALTAAVELAVPFAQDSDSGLQFRYQQIMAYVRPGLAARPRPLAPPAVPVLLPPRYVRVTFSGEAGVKFTLDEHEFTLPLQLNLPPGDYSLKWLDQDDYIIKRIKVLNSATQNISISVPISHQKTPIL